MRYSAVVSSMRNADDADDFVLILIAPVSVEPNLCRNSTCGHRLRHRAKDSSDARSAPKPMMRSGNVAWILSVASDKRFKNVGVATKTSQRALIMHSMIVLGTLLSGTTTEE